MVAWVQSISGSSETREKLVLLQASTLEPVDEMVQGSAIIDQIDFSTHLEKGGHLHQIGATVSQSEEVEAGLIEAGQGLCIMLQGPVQQAGS